MSISSIVLSLDADPPPPDSNAPPPPGLVVPIDDHTNLLILTGLGLGMYFFVSNEKPTQRMQADFQKN